MFKYGAYVSKRKRCKKDVAKGLSYMRKACDVGDWNGVEILPHITMDMVIKMKPHYILRKLVNLADLILLHKITQIIKAFGK